MFLFDCKEFFPAFDKLVKLGTGGCLSVLEPSLVPSTLPLSRLIELVLHEGLEGYVLWPFLVFSSLTDY